jgi:hypothetical protein
MMKREREINAYCGPILLKYPGWLLMLVVVELPTVLFTLLFSQVHDPTLAPSKYTIITSIMPELCDTE